MLLWRPVTHGPFNSQRFKGPLAELPKPPDVYRVMCYGDSLTDGPPRGGWPSWLHRLFSEQSPAPGRRTEVLNAGVAGYSSHQGLLRFLQEVDHYQPDLVLVSFGWNDAAEAIGQPDKTFKIPPWPLIVSQRALVRIEPISWPCITHNGGEPSRPSRLTARFHRASACPTTWPIWTDSEPRRPREASQSRF